MTATIRPATLGPVSAGPSQEIIDIFHQAVTYLTLQDAALGSGDPDALGLAIYERMEYACLAGYLYGQAVARRAISRSN